MRTSTVHEPGLGAHAAQESFVEETTQPNLLLRAMPAEAIAALEPHMERMEVSLLEVLADSGEPHEHVYFPETGVVSIVNKFEDGTEVEVGTIGNEGMSGLNVVLGADSIPGVTMMEVPGSAVRVPASVMKAVVDEHPEVLRLLHRYAQAFLLQVGQTAACNRAHEIYGRCARWMCMAHDRNGGASQFLLAQHVLAQMLGVRRAGVTVAAGALQKKGYIRYSRGKITILDRPGLESAACECYAIVKREYDRLLGA